MSPGREVRREECGWWLLRKLSGVGRRCWRASQSPRPLSLRSSPSTVPSELSRLPPFFLLKLRSTPRRFKDDVTTRRRSRRRVELNQNQRCRLQRDHRVERQRRRRRRSRPRIRISSRGRDKLVARGTRRLPDEGSCANDPPRSPHRFASLQPSQPRSWRRIWKSG